MSERFAEARRALPTLQIGQRDFETEWNKRPEAAEERACDVLLAAGIVLRDAGALGWLRSEIRRALAMNSARIPQAISDEVESKVLQLIAVGDPPQEPHIHRWSALGPLAGWIHVIVFRCGRTISRSAFASSAERLDQHILDEVDDPNRSTGPLFERLRQKYRSHLAESLRIAVGVLEPKSRTILSLHYLEGVGLDELARIYNVHRATISRWLLAAREDLFERTRAELAAQARLDVSEADSLVKALGGQLEISLKRILAG